MKTNLKTIFFTVPIIFIFSINTNGQTFEKNYRTPSDELVYDAQFIDSTVCIFPLNIGDFMLDTYSVKFFKIDVQTGFFLDSLVIEPLYQDHYFRGLFDFLKLNDSLYIGTGKFRRIDQTAEIQYIVHINNDLQVIFDTVVDMPVINENLQKSIISSDNSIISVGRDMNPGGNKILIERNIDGEFIRYMNYDYMTSLTATTIIDIPQKNKYHLFFWGGILHSFFIIDKNSLEIDTIIECPSQFLPIDGIIDPFDTSTYYIAGKQGMTNPENYLSFLKFNTNGAYAQYIYPNDQNIFYTYKCLSPSLNHLYFGGVYPFTQSPPTLYPEQRWILIYRLNKDGSIVWQKFYKGEVNYMAYKILATADGSALIFSTRYDWNDPIPNQRDVHILKIDSTGYYNPITGTDEELTQMNKQILVYPNPADNEVNFVLGLYSNLQLSIYNSTGERKIFQSLPSSQTIDVSELPSGIYVYLLTGKNGFKETGKIIKE
jgi:hypothetical protein